VRVKDLARSTRLYAWLLGAEPKEWTHRYATFLRPALRTNFVLLVSFGKALHHDDTLYHLGVAVAEAAAVVRAYELAKARASRCANRRGRRGAARRSTSSGSKIRPETSSRSTRGSGRRSARPRRTIASPRR
jgi:catechol 2,3-dioxygenase-like lactoylglutathione lyase family enzyme